MKVVCAAIIRNEKIGIAKRKSKISNGIYEFPGGKVEDNETEIEALKREIKEECGIEIENIQFFMKNKDFQEEEIDLMKVNVVPLDDNIDLYISMLIMSSPLFPNMVY